MAGVNLRYVKGVRTRYFNVLDKEVQVGLTLLDTNIDGLSDQECKIVRQQVSECKLKINTYIEKLSNQSEKLAQAVGDSDEELTQEIVEDDSSLSDKALSVFYKLQLLEEVLSESDKKENHGKKDPLVPEYEESVVQKMCDFQMKLQREFFIQQQERSEIQMRMQQEFLETHKTHKPTTAIKLPRINIIGFSGNQLQWTEFWDSFESAVHRNDTLSPIDKFNYLKGKRTGEARSAIAGLTLSNGNYVVAIRILQERFGDRQDIVDTHYKRLINLAPVRNTVESLRFFMDTIERHLRGLEVLEDNLDQHVFVSMIRSKLPSDVLLQLELLKGADNKWTIHKLRDLLRQYTVSKEKAGKTETQNHRDNNVPKFQPTRPNTSFRGYASQTTPKYTTEALVASERKRPLTQPTRKCRFCEKDHWSDQCDKYKTVEERKQRLKGSCFKCLRDNHLAKECKSSRVCAYCGRVSVHHRSLCEIKFQKKSIKESVHLSEELNSAESVYEEAAGLLSYNETVLMQTALTEVKGNSNVKSEKVRLILDTGSHRTYITKSLAERLCLPEENEQEIRLVTFGSEKAKIVKTKSTTLNVRLKNGNYMTMTANIVPSISGVIQRHAMKHEHTERLIAFTQNLTLADTITTETESSSLELLVGNDYYLDIIESEKIVVDPGLYLISSKFGWILSGRTSSGNSKDDANDINMLILTHGNNLTEKGDTSLFQGVDEVLPQKPNLEDFWNVESIGITDETANEADEKVLEKFEETLKRENGRYQVTWPWKEEIQDLPENRGLALGRLKSLVNKIQKQPELIQRYDAVIQDQLQKGVIESVDRGTCDGIRHYIPHHVVIKPQKDTTKLRVVYDASARARKENQSLNECLYRGHVLLRNVCGILLRFRIPKIGIVSDIEKAFLQVELQPSERDVTRLFWFKDYRQPLVDEKHIQELRFRRVPFGVISSPFLLGATIEHHLNLYGSPLADQLKENIYMDNVVTGADTVVEATSLYRCAKTMFSEAKMNLRESKTNNEQVNSEIVNEDLEKDETIKVLGHTWNTETDTLAIQRSDLLNKELINTKRKVLKQLASIFDPLGLFAPVTLRGKLLLQTVWSKHLNWDDELEAEYSSQWMEIKCDLMKIDDVVIKRCVSIPDQRSETKYVLVCFCDASSKAYATSIYLAQQTKSSAKSDMIFSKTRLAPLKSMSIPRLELLAVLIGVRSMKFVEAQIKLPMDSIVLMTDAQCVLQWISSKKKRPVFIENRVKEIRRHENIQFRYVNTKENPADTASRGCTTSDLSKNKGWWHGPEWILLPLAEWPQLMKESDQTIESSASDRCMKSDVTGKQSDNTLGHSEAQKESALQIQPASSTAPFGIDEDNYSSVTRLIRVTAWCQRFVNRTRGKQCTTSHLTSDELKAAECKWQQYSQRKQYADQFDAIVARKQNNLVKQLDLFSDEGGMLRCGGRLENANFSEAARFPILLPAREKLTLLFIERDHRKLMHSVVSQILSEGRHRFWIPHGRATVSKVLKSCKICQKTEVLTSYQLWRRYQSRAFQSQFHFQGLV